MPNRLQQLFGDRPILCDGATGTTLYDHGVFINRCYDELNLSEADMVRSIHEEYLLAGAELIETNTFGANRFRLQRFGLQDKVEAINQAGVRLAREAVSQLHEKQASKAWIAGSVGPLGIELDTRQDKERNAPRAAGPELFSPEEARDAYAEQMRALASGGPGTEPNAGVDLLIIETVMSLAEAEQALLAAHEAAPNLPVVVMVTVDEQSLCLDGTQPDVAAARLAAWGADGIGVNCSTGPAAVLAAIQSMAAASRLPLFAMPNAGMPRAVDGRNIYLSSPEYMASYSRKFLKAGVQFVGGCCGTTPAHIRAMRASLRAQSAQKSAQATAQQEAERSGKNDAEHSGQNNAEHSGQNGLQKSTRPSVEIMPDDATAPLPLRARSVIGRLLEERHFITLVEIVPPRGIDTTRELAGARLLAQHGIDAINVPDSPRASARMSAQSLCIQIQQNATPEFPIETVLHYTCRDRNILSIQSDLLGASSIGLKNILCLTGDPPKLGNYPDATAVFDVDAIGLTKIVRKLNYGLDIGGNALGVSTNFTIAVAANPGVPDIENEIRRFAYKVEAGAEYAITQPVFDLRLLESFLKRVEQFRIPVIAGIWPLTSLRNAEFMRNDLRVAVPDEIMTRMAAAGTKEAAQAEGILIAQEMLSTARPMVQGVAASAPFNRYQTAVETLSAVLEERAAIPVTG